MIGNYFKIAVRNILRSKGYSAINIFGLAIGIAICILIMIYTQHELSFDRSHPYAENTFRIAYAPNENTGFKGIAKSPIPLSPAIRAEYPEVQEAVRFFKVGSGSATGPPVRYEDVKFTEDNFYLADPNVFDVFDVKLVVGDKQTVFKNTHSVVLSEETAKRYFGNDNPIGKVIHLESAHDLEVTGIFRSVNDKTHFNFDFLSPFELLRVMWPNWSGHEDSWGTPFTWTYLVLNNSDQVQSLQDKLPDFIQRYYPQQVRDRAGNFKFTLQPVTGIHFDSHMSREMEPNSTRATIYTLIAIGALVLIIACINFMNMATARSVRRAREVGLRKVLGASRQSLVKQFIGEAYVFSLLASLVGVILAALFLPLFNTLTGAEIGFNNVGILQLLVACALLAFIVGLFSGSYPSLFLSAFKPIRTLKGELTAAGGSLVRKGLVIFQFIITIVFIISIVTINRQMQFIQAKELGYNEEELLILSRPNGDLSIEAIRQSLMSVPGVKGVVNSAGSLPGQTLQSWTYLPNSNAEENRKGMLTIWAGRDFINLFGLELIDGRDFSTLGESDSLELVIINEAAAKEIGWENDVVGRYFGEAVWRSDKVNDGVVLGLVKDFHFQTLHEPVQPLVIIYAENFGNVLIEVSMDNVAETLNGLETKWNEMAPNAPFDYAFLDDRVEQLYENESTTSDVISTFTIIAVLISCLGLFGLASYTAEQKTKEIGIRKVLGASISQVLVMLSKSLIALLALAFIVAVPTGIYFMNKWLEGFAYKIEIGLGTFIIAAGIALTISVITISSQTIRAALSSPVDALRQD